MFKVFVAELFSCFKEAMMSTHNLLSAFWSAPTRCHLYMNIISQRLIKNSNLYVRLIIHHIFHPEKLAFRLYTPPQPIWHPFQWIWGHSRFPHIQRVSAGRATFQIERPSRKNQKCFWRTKKRRDWVKKEMPWAYRNPFVSKRLPGGSKKDWLLQK